MRLSAIGIGYVGLPLGAAFASMGNQVIMCDVDANKIEQLQNGIIPIFEPGLDTIIERNFEQLIFTTSIEQAIQESDIIFICVGTPSDIDGSADLQYVIQVASDIGKYLNGYKIVVDKSTVPIGTADKVKSTIQRILNDRGIDYKFDVVSCPEFMREGCAVEDCLRPDRVVIGASDDRVALVLKELYEPFMMNGNPIIITDVRSAEMIKYASNCFLATKISFMNEVANLCEVVGADVTEVRRGMGADKRIGDKFLYAGLGFGGSCFSKDIIAFINTQKMNDIESKIIQSTLDLNRQRPYDFIDKIFKTLKLEKVAIWGLAFKPETDDIREAPSLKIIEVLLNRSIKIQAFDPMAMENVKKVFNSDLITFYDDQYESLQGVDALILCTEWKQFRVPDFSLMKSKMKQLYIFDGRNQYKPEKVKAEGFNYLSIGR